MRDFIARHDYETLIDTLDYLQTLGINAIELLPSFDDLHFVIVEGGSHGALGEAMGYSSEFRAALMNFVATGEGADLPDEILMPYEND